MPIRAGLVGDSADLVVLAEVFPERADPAVGSDRDGYHLFSSLFTEDLFDDASALHGVATELLTVVNGVARVRDSGFRPVELSGMYRDDAGHQRAVVVLETVELRIRAHLGAVAIVSGQDAEVHHPPPVAPSYVAAARQHTNARDALAILGRVGPLNWYDLYKLYEIVGDHVFRDQPITGPRVRLQDALKATGWIAADELNSFTASANHQGASGEAARHARLAGPPPAKSMDLPTARLVIRNLVDRWLASL